MSQIVTSQRQRKPILQGLGAKGEPHWKHGEDANEDVL